MLKRLPGRPSLPHKSGAWQSWAEPSRTAEAPGAKRSSSSPNKSKRKRESRPAEMSAVRLAAAAEPALLPA